MNQSERMQRWLETAKPYLAGLAVAVAHFCAVPGWVPQTTEILSSTTNLAGIAVGFLGTGYGLLLTLSGSRIVRELKKLNAFNLLVKYFHHAIWLGLATACVSLVLATAWPDAKLPSSGSTLLSRWPRLWSAWFGVIVATSYYTVRVIRHFLTVAEAAANDASQ